jgi:hypothetical protein
VLAHDEQWSLHQLEILIIDYIIRIEFKIKVTNGSKSPKKLAGALQKPKQIPHSSSRTLQKSLGNM